MKSSLSTFALVFAFITTPARGATYSRSDCILGTDFLTKFTFEAVADPSNGRVNYVDEATAVNTGLVSTTSTTFTMGADDTTVLDPNGPGRNSVRIKSTKSYTTHVAVFDVNHMPQGCGTWPAIWETDEDDWPNGGEADIVEGVNDQAPNTVTLHTSPGCTVPSSGRNQTGTVLSTDCAAADNGNDGCAVGLEPNSYGPPFNALGGGWYAIERTDSFISVWFWSRLDGAVPSDVSNPQNTVNTDNWSTPSANFPDTSCDIGSKFDSNNIIINLTFCGGWAGNATVYGASGCPSTCVDYVNNNPSAFSNAYFEFASLSVYQ